MSIYIGSHQFHIITHYKYIILLVHRLNKILFIYEENETSQISSYFIYTFNAFPLL